MLEIAAASERLIEAARDLVPMLREQADRVDILKPKAYGGLELEPYEHAMVTLQLARNAFGGPDRK